MHFLALPNGYFAATYYDNTVKIWTTYDFKCIHKFKLHNQAITLLMLVDDIIQLPLGKTS
jgi:hypothetical protein